MIDLDDLVVRGLLDKKDLPEKVREVLSAELVIGNCAEQACYTWSNTVYDAWVLHRVHLQFESPSPASGAFKRSLWQI